MAANSALGTLLKLEGTLIAQRTKITPSPVTRAKLETTNLDSTWETSIAGIPRAGQLKFEINYDAGNATHASIWTWMGNGSIGNWTTTLADTGAADLIVNGYVVEFAVGEASVDAIQKATITVQPSGALTLTP